MKYLLIILLSCMHDCYAQKKLTFEEADSLSKAGVPINAKYDSIYHTIYYQLYKADTFYTPSVNFKFIKPEHKYDTVLSILLLADTSERSVDNLNQVYWDIGYEVRDSYDNKKSYLDIDKKPLLKSIIVWQSKEF